MSSAKEIKLQLSKGCSMYDACPLCFNCMNKASHLYERCLNCEVEHDAHSYKNRVMLIKRENFAITVTDETAKKLNDYMNSKEE